MKTIKVTNTRNPKFVNENQLVEMILYFVRNGKVMDNVIKSSFPPELLIRIQNDSLELQDKSNNFRNSLYYKIIELETNPDFINSYFPLIPTYLCFNPDILEGIKKYPQGGSAIIAHVNVLDETLSTFQFLDPITVDNHKRIDYSVVPTKTDERSDPKEALTKILSNDELIFLMILMKLVDRLCDNKCCNLSNDELYKVIPNNSDNKKWIAETLGILYHHNIIDVLLYDISGCTWRRDIFIRNLEFLDVSSAFLNRTESE